MSTVTVLEKIYGSNSVATFEEHYSRLVEGLDVQLHFLGKTERGWMQLDISGKDQTIALNLLDQEIGLAPRSVDDLQKFSVVKGRIVFSKKHENELYVDLGIVSPEPCDAVISEKTLRAQLADGKNVSFKELVELFCLHDNIPLEVKLTESVNKKNGTVAAVLSEVQVSLFRSWVRSRFDRLIILGARFSDVERAIKGSRHDRDIIKTESLGALEQIIFCKLGTDAVGLIPKIGRYIKSAVLVPFSPKKILVSIGNQSFDG